MSAAAAAAAAEDAESLDGGSGGLFDSVDADRTRRRRSKPTGSVAAASSSASPSPGSEQQRRLRQLRRQQQLAGASATPTTSPSSRRSAAGASSRLSATDEEAASGLGGSPRSTTRTQQRQPKSPLSTRSNASANKSDGRRSGGAGRSGGGSEVKGPVEKVSKVRKLGTLESSVKYDSSQKVVTVKIIQTHELPRPGTYDFGGKLGTNLKWNSIQVTLALLPEKKQRNKTTIAKGDNPQFDETFMFTNISSVEFGRLGIRFRAYGCQHKRRKLLMAENILALASLASPKNETILHLPLELRAGDYARRGSEDAKDDADELQVDGWTSLGVTGFPELFVGITYNASTGQLATEIIKGSSFKLPGMSRTPETYVKISLMASNGHVLFKSKTTSSEGTQNPMWKENFVFPVNKFQLTDMTIMVAVYAKKTMNRREIIGWFSIGCNNSGEEELAHWQDMKDAHGEPVRRWHRLLQTDLKS
uniref:C2 domain-containing protein n=1 Tax=Macrostomum lignano TaxID=282301 RepID=A0A1I8GK94_9PLAT